MTTSIIIAIAACIATAHTPGKNGSATAETMNTGNAAADTSRVYDLDEVIIVSQPKEVTRLRQQPLSSTVFTGGDLNRLGINSLSALSYYVPSFSMPAYGSRLTASAYVRGIGSRVDNPAVGIYSDGIPLVNKCSYNFHTYQMDRIDVLRGPQGTLYGMNSEGGIVRLYSKDPMKYYGTDIVLSLGSHLYRNVELAHYHRPSSKLAFSVAAFYNGQNGFFRNSTTDRRADNYDEAGAKARLVYQPNTKFTANIVADYQYTSQNAFAYGELDTKTGHISSPSGNRPNTYRRNMLNTGIGITYRLDGIQINSQTSYQFLRDNMAMDQDYLPLDLMHLAQRQTLNALTQELSIKSNTEAAWQHTSGLYVSQQWLRTEAPVSFDTDFTDRIASGIQSAMYSSIHTAMAEQMAAAGMPQQAAEQMAASIIEQAGGVSAGVQMQVPGLFHTPQLNIGIFHESNIRLLPRLTATVGLRYDYSRVAVRYDTRAAMTVSANVMGTSAENTLSSKLNGKSHNSYNQLLPKIGLTATLSDNGSNIYATVSKGYRAGGFNIQMFSDILQSELTANSAQAMKGSYDIPHTADDYKKVNSTISYKPEESWNYELGAHLNIPGWAMQADFAAYYMQVRNQQLSVMADAYGFGRMMVNAGRSRSIGVEAALRGSLADNRLQWGVTYALTDAEFTEYSETAEDGSRIDYKGNSVPFVPHHTLSARCDLRLPFGTSRKLAALFGADMTAQGSTYWDAANTESQPLYAILNLHLGLQYADTSIRLWCRNATNTHYATFAFSSSASGNDTWFAQRGNPIQFGVDLRLNLQ